MQFCDLGGVVQTPTGSFTRVINNNQFTVLAKKSTFNTDHVFPGIATNISVSESDLSQSSVKISWRAPGDDGFVGKSKIFNKSFKMI